MMASFSAAQNFTISQISSRVPGLTAAEGTRPSISYPANCAESVMTFAAPEISASRVTVSPAASVMAASRPASYFRFVAAARIFPRSLSCSEKSCRIQQSLRVKDCPHALHELQIGFAEKQRHQPVFFHSHAMLARDRSARLHAKRDDFVRRRHRIAKLLLVALVEQNDRVQVSVAGVKHVADLQAVRARDFSDAPQSSGQFRAGNYAV